MLAAKRSPGVRTAVGRAGSVGTALLAGFLSVFLLAASDTVMLLSSAISEDVAWLVSMTSMEGAAGIAAKSLLVSLGVVDELDEVVGPSMRGVERTAATVCSCCVFGCCDLPTCPVVNFAGRGLRGLRDRDFFRVFGSGERVGGRKTKGVAW